MSGDTISVCRVCLKQEKITKSIFEFDSEAHLNYSDKIIQCTGISIEIDDGYPTAICLTCRGDLATTYHFVTKCRESDKTLREYKPDLPIKSELEEGDVYAEDADAYSPLQDFKDNEVKTEEITNNDIESILYVQKKKKSKKKEYKKSKCKNIQTKFQSSETKCQICGLITAGKAALVIHMRRHTGEKPFQCTECDMRFAQMGTLKVHFVRRHSNESRHLRDRRFSCEVCGMRFFTNRDLQVHTRRHTGDQPYACELCNQRFTQIGSLIRHRRTHTGERPFTCKTCGKSFTDGSVLKSHQSVHSEERKFTCNICGKAFKSRNALNKHISLHKDSKPFVCDQCGMRFSTKGNLKLHNKNLHSENSGTCSECGKHVANMKEHERKHTGEAIYSCTICGKSYPVKRSLSIHMNRHLNADKHKCDKENCSKSFPRKFQLEFHLLKYHSTEVPFLCKVCSKGYLRLSDLRKHLRVYHPNYDNVSLLISTPSKIE